VHPLVLIGLIWTIQTDISFFKKSVLLIYIFLQVQKLTKNIQFILETVMLSTIVEVQVILWCDYVDLFANNFTLASK
jgi:hypothetical protein